MATNDQLPVNVESGYENGSDFLLEIDGQCVGSCTSHKISYSSDTKDHAVKPPAVETASGISLFKQSSVTGLSYEISFEGLVAVKETERKFGDLRMLWRAAKPIKVKAFKRGSNTTPYLVGNVIISSLEENNPAQDDTTYSGSLKSCGAPETFTA